MSNNSISLKLVRKNDTRRISIVPSQTSFVDLVKLASTLYNEPSLDGAAVLRYRDSEQDVVNVTSDIELREAYNQAAKSTQVLKFWVMDKNTNVPNANGAAAAEVQHPLMRLRFCGRQEQPQQQQQHQQQVHHAFCDSCRERIVGIRFKCQQCPDYDLCERCEPKNADGSIHPLSHSFTRIEKAQQSPAFGFGGCPMWRQRGTAHPATCDSCEERIVGVRFKCQQCPDYDLCERCQPKNADGSIHTKSHSFERIEFATRQHWRAAFEATHRAQQQQQQQQPANNNNNKQEAEVVKPVVSVPVVGAVESKKDELPATVAPLKLRIVTPKATATTEQNVEAKPTVDQANNNNNTAAAVEPAKPAASVSNSTATDANDNSKPSVAPAFEDKLKKLQEMGFVDVQKNIVALVESRGDMYGAVRKLLQ